MDVTGVSLDLSKSRTGVAVWQDGKLVEVYDKSFSELELHSEIFLEFREWAFVGLIERHKPDWIALERARPRNMNHAEIFYGMTAILTLLVARSGKVMHFIHWATAKKVLAGHGKANKPQMLAAAQEQFPDSGIQNHDQADAVAVGLAFMREVGIG